MKTLSTLLLALSCTLALAQPYGGWESATYVSMRISYDGVSHCRYRSYSGYEFEIEVQGTCPSNVIVNPRTGQTQY